MPQKFSRQSFFLQSSTVISLTTLVILISAAGLIGLAYGRLQTGYIPLLRAAVVGELMLIGGSVGGFWLSALSAINRGAMGSDEQGKLSDQPESQIREHPLWDLIEATAALTGQDFFATLAQRIAQILDVPYVMVSERRGEQMHPLAFWADGALQPSTAYDLADTPCELVLKHGKFYCERSLQQQFPQDVSLAEMDIESCLGIAMRDSSGVAIGDLCILDRQPIRNTQWAEDIVAVFAARAASELERQCVSTALRQLNEELEVRVKVRTTELWERERFLQTVLDTFPLFVFWKDKNLAYMGGNRNFVQDAGLSSVAELVGKTDFDLAWATAETEIYRIEDETVINSREPILGAVKTKLRKGSIRWVETNLLPLWNAQGEVAGVLGTYQDITTRKQAEIALQQSEARLRLITDSVQACISYTDATERYQFVNRTYEEWFGRSRDTIVGRHIEEVIGSQAYQKAQKFVERALSGETVSYEMDMPYGQGTSRHVSAVLVPDNDDGGQVNGYYALIHDISPLKRTQQRIIYNALHDPLTGLPNRTLLIGRLEQSIRQAKQLGQYHYAVLFLDLDRFKVVNDSLGHTAGDDLLRAIARRLSSYLRDIDCVARLGGDEFVMLLENVDSTDYVMQLIERMLSETQMSFTIGKYEVFTGLSIGVVFGSAIYTQPADLIRNADIAMYQVKANGGNGYRIFDAMMHAHMVERLTLETELRKAINHREFVVYYQPIVNLCNQQLMGFEALVRWHHPTRQLISPGEFIPVAEEMGLIGALDSWMFQRACEQIADWRRSMADASDLRMSINLSAQDLRRANLVQDICDVLTQTGLAGSAITLEITESLLIDDIHRTIDILSQLVALEIRISIDDFGTGYSSLSYLHQLPIHYLKIDSSFVSPMVQDNRHYEVISTIITLSARLGLTAIAEGIETLEQLQQLQQLGCELGQGYLFSEAIAPSRIEARFWPESSHY
ncbi:MAG: EAL domain-containing protein [Elainellaceae cyanobacterium]